MAPHQGGGRDFSWGCHQPGGQAVRAAALSLALIKLTKQAMGKSILWAHSSLESEPKEVNKGWLLRWTVSGLGILSALNSLSIVENYLHGSLLTTLMSVLASSPTTPHISWAAPGGHVCVCVCVCVCVYVGGYVFVCVCTHT